MDKLAFLRTLSLNGVEFVINFPSVGGSDSLSATPEQLVEFSSNPDAYIAKRCRVSLNEYLMWREEGYAVQCSANTKAGKRCKNIVNGADGVTPAEWAQLHGEYCTVHGGG